MALYAIFLELQTLPLNLKVEGLILYQQRANDYSEYSKESSRIRVPKGSYSIEDFEALVKKHIPDFSFKFNKDNKIELQMAITTRIVLTPNLIEMASLSKALKAQWFTLGPHFSETPIYKQKDNGILQLHCKQLAKSNHLINEVYTNCLCVLPLTTNPHLDCYLSFFLLPHQVQFLVDFFTLTTKSTI